MFNEILEQKGVLRGMDKIFDDAVGVSDDIAQFLSPKNKKSRRIEKIDAEARIGLGVAIGGSLMTWAITCNNALAAVVFFYTALLKGSNILGELHQEQYYRNKAKQDFVTKAEGGHFFDACSEEHDEVRDAMIEICGNAIAEGVPVTSDFIAKAKSEIVEILNSPHVQGDKPDLSGSASPAFVFG